MGGKNRLVREDGSYSEVAISRYSRSSCQVHLELPVGELVSLEFTDIALLVGQVSASEAGRSSISFLRSAVH
jgi:hypothetical protein